MSEPKWDIWGKHKSHPEMNKPDFHFFYPISIPLADWHQWIWNLSAPSQKWGVGGWIKNWHALRCNYCCVWRSPPRVSHEMMFTIGFLHRDLRRHSKTVTYLCWHQALGQPWQFFRHNVPCTNLFADVGYDTTGTCQTLGAVPSSVERYSPSKAHPCLTSVTWARSKSSID